MCNYLGPALGNIRIYIFAYMSNMASHFLHWRVSANIYTGTLRMGLTERLLLEKIGGKSEDEGLEVF